MPRINSYCSNCTFTHFPGSFCKRQCSKCNRSHVGPCKEKQIVVKNIKKEVNSSVILTKSDDENKVSNYWYLDSGANTHLTNNYNVLFNTSKSKQRIVSANGTVSESSMIGSVLIKLSNDSVVQLDNVLYLEFETKILYQF